MPPLTLQRTLESLRSWWSDSNPNLRGPTINLHAAAKPLMRFLYDRQALEFARNNRGIPLSAMGWDIYWSYILCEYVSASTKGVILDNIVWRSDFESEALVVDSNMIHDLLQLLEVPLTDNFSSKIWRILETLASCEATAAVTCSSLVALLCDSDVPQVIDGALLVLSRIPQIKFPLATSGVSIEAKLLDRLLDILKDSSAATWRYPVIFQMISDLALHEPTAVTVVEANIVNSAEKLLISRPTNLYEHILLMLESLVSHESTVIHWRLRGLLVTLWKYLVHSPFNATRPVIDMLAHIRVEMWRDGTQGVVKAKLLNDIFGGLQSDNTGMRRYTCRLLRELVRHQSTLHAVMVRIPRDNVEALLRYSPHLSSLSKSKCIVPETGTTRFVIVQPRHCKKLMSDWNELMGSMCEYVLPGMATSLHTQDFQLHTAKMPRSNFSYKLLSHFTNQHSYFGLLANLGNNPMRLPLLKAWHTWIGLGINS
ncbi:hypothetical protein C8J57DRAFT_1224175 [Mycena rebaudengoi]|nr:hypothetical protein C8J57DRAFT_1224175 [Mycena rebaudengoi]